MGMSATETAVAAGAFERALALGIEAVLSATYTMGPIPDLITAVLNLQKPSADFAVQKPSADFALEKPSAEFELLK